MTVRRNINYELTRVGIGPSHIGEDDAFRMQLMSSKRLSKAVKKRAMSLTLYAEGAHAVADSLITMRSIDQTADASADSTLQKAEALLEYASAAKIVIEASDANTSFLKQILKYVEEGGYRYRASKLREGIDSFLIADGLLSDDAVAVMHGKDRWFLRILEEAGMEKLGDEVRGLMELYKAI